MIERLEKGARDPESLMEYGLQVGWMAFVYPAYRFRQTVDFLSAWLV